MILKEKFHEVLDSLETSPERDLDRFLDDRLQNCCPDVRNRLKEEFLGVGPLKKLLQDPSVTDIFCNGPNIICFEKLGRVQWHDDLFLSCSTFKNFVERICTESNQTLSIEHPFASFQWQQFRVHATFSSIEGRNPLLTFRRTAEKVWDLSKGSFGDPQAIKQIEDLVQTRSNFLIVGPSGAGKTSLLEACLNQVDRHQRCVLIEDTPELRAPNPISLKLLTQSSPKRIDQFELVRQTLRMRPDRIVLGEIRGTEAKDFLLALATGHQGGLATLHANCGPTAILRLQMLIQLAAPQWDGRTILRLIHQSLNAIVVMKKGNNGSRMVSRIDTLCSLEEHGLTFDSVVFDDDAKRRVAEGCHRL